MDRTDLHTESLHHATGRVPGPHRITPDSGPTLHDGVLARDGAHPPRRQTLSQWLGNHVPQIMGAIVLMVMLLVVWIGSNAPAPGIDSTTADTVGVQGQGEQAGQGGLSQLELQHLLYMREEEKMARDVYTLLAQQWRMAIFVSISRSEQRHTDQMTGLLARYGIPDPVAGMGYGKFQDPRIVKLYQDLMARGMRSRADALGVGGMIEEVDIHDLDQAIEVTSQPDILRVYQNIQRGSRNHLRSFAHSIEAMGSLYRAQHLPGPTVMEIITGPMETGRP
jgi:hypothetical protein